MSLVETMARRYLPPKQEGARGFYKVWVSDEPIMAE